MPDWAAWSSNTQKFKPAWLISPHNLENTPNHKFAKLTNKHGEREEFTVGSVQVEDCPLRCAKKAGEGKPKKSFWFLPSEGGGGEKHSKTNLKYSAEN